MLYRFCCSTFGCRLACRKKNIPNPKTQSGVSGCFQYVMPILLLIALPVSVLTTSLFSAMRHGFAPQNGQGRISTCLAFMSVHPLCIYCRRTSRLARWKTLHLPSMRRNRFHRPLRSRLVLRFWIHSVSELFRLFGLCSPVRSGKIPNK